MYARRDSACRKCGFRIRIGQPIQYVRRRWVHVNCPVPAPRLSPMQRALGLEYRNGLLVKRQRAACPLRHYAHKHP